MFDIYYIGNNQKLVDFVPFAKQVDSVEKINPKTKMYWLIESNIEILDYDIFNFRPENYDQKYLHKFKWNQSNYGGVSLRPRKYTDDGIKEVNKVVCKKTFDMLYSKTPMEYFNDNPFASHVWCVDKEYKLSDNIEWAPSNFEPDFIHSFHLRGQLEHKYPAQEGGIKLFPKDWKNADTKYHGFLDASANFPVMFVRNVEDYKQRNTFKEDYVWLIDSKHKIDMNSIDWVPNPFEQDMIHVFRMPYQLTDRYPMAMGGIRLVPKNWKKAEIKIHPACPIQDEVYDVFYIEEDEFRDEEYEEIAERSKTDWFWVVDREYDFNGKLLYVPETHEEDYIHVFKIPGHLEERYPPDNTKPWDNRCGGVRLVSKNFDMTKHKYQKNVVPVRYDIFYTDDLTNYETYSRKSRTKMFWLVDHEHDISEVFNYVPHRYDQKAINVFKVRDQLEYKYPKSVTNISDKRCGGVKLVPKKYDESNQKFISVSPTGSKSYPVTKVTNIDDLKSVDQDGWIVDEDYLIDDKIEWTPPDFQRQSMHVFHVQGQLRHKYPDNMGGLRWVPTDWDGTIVIHGELDVGKRLVINRVDNPAEDYKQYSDCWLIDSMYKLELDDLKWAPDLFDRNMVHVFHVYNQLTDKYQEEMGGVYWLPAEPESAEIKIHTKPLHLSVDQYPIHFAKDPSVPLEDSAHWVIDDQYKIDKSKINWVPDMFDMDKIHVFQIKNQLTLKYPDQMGGMYWHPTNVTKPLLKVHQEPMELDAVGYPVLRVDDPADFSVVKEDCWLVDQEYIIEDSQFSVIPWQTESEKLQVHNYQVTGQLEHKYPETVGGIYWVPANRNSEMNVHSISPFGDQLSFPVFETEEEGRKQSTSSWFWVVDPNVIVHEDFNFDFIPKVWDNGKTHVWQKLRPDTGRQYDYAGVMLCPKVPQTKGRPKYIKESACTQREYPVYHLQPEDYKDGLNDVYVRLAGQTTTDMFWVVDAFTNIHEDFTFDLYPTQWEKNNVHAFADEDGNFNNIRLLPKQTFIDNKYTDKEIANNTFKNLKQMNTIASYRPKWPIVDLTNQYPVYHIQPEDYKDGLNSVYVRLAAQTIEDMFWVVDAFTTLHQDFNFEHYPTQEETKYVHVFADNNNEFKNVRLIPKSALSKEYTNKEIANNSFEDLKQINTIASLVPKWPVIYLQSLEKKEFTNAIKDIDAPFVWTVDPDIKVEQEVLDSGFMPVITDVSKVHAWQKTNPRNGKVHAYGGLRLWPTDADYTNITTSELKLNRIKNMQYVRHVGSETLPFEVVVLSYKEDLSLVEQHIQKLVDKGITVEHVRGVKGIFNAHKEASNKVNSKMFWVVDADAEVTDDFDFDYIPDVYDEEVVHVWASSNPVTGTEYGYGGVKLFPTEMVRDASSWGLDFTTGLSSRFKSLPQISCKTKFNTDAFSTWRSAFRECVKLTLNDDTESSERLEAWLHPVQDADFRHDAKRGAEQGKEFAIANRSNLTQLDKINDFKWLEETYESTNRNN